MKPAPRYVDHPTFAKVLEQFHAEKKTGTVIVHFAQGHAVKLEIPCAPQQISLATRGQKS